MKRLFAALVGAVMLIAGMAHAQSPAAGSKRGYPSRPVRLITPVIAGSAVDTVARIVGQKLTDSWGQQVVVDNRVGAQRRAARPEREAAHTRGGRGCTLDGIA